MPSASSQNLFQPPPPTPFSRFLVSPIIFISRWLYTHQVPLPPPLPGSPPIRVVCISDTHGQTPRLPPGDILIHAGDMCVNGTADELAAQIAWLEGLEYKYKIVIAGNHDVCLGPETRPPQQTMRDVPSTPNKLEVHWGSINYLANTSTTAHVNGRRLKIYGCPWTPRYGNWAFQYLPQHAAQIWQNTVPIDTDILVTHGPARGHLDADSPSLGCRELLREVKRVRPQLHVCGHVHRARGREVVDWDGRVQGGYDAICLGEGGVVMLVGMVGWWLYEWILWGCRRRVGVGEVVNVAMEEDGDGGVVVEM